MSTFIPEQKAVMWKHNEFVHHLEVIQTETLQTCALSCPTLGVILHLGFLSAVTYQTADSDERLGRAQRTGGVLDCTNAVGGLEAGQPFTKPQHCKYSQQPTGPVSQSSPYSLRLDPCCQGDGAALCVCSSVIPFLCSTCDLPVRAVVWLVHSGY